MGNCVFMAAKEFGSVGRTLISGVISFFVLFVAVEAESGFN